MLHVVYVILLVYFTLFYSLSVIDFIMMHTKIKSLK